MQTNRQRVVSILIAKWVITTGREQALIKELDKAERRGYQRAKRKHTRRVGKE